MGIVQPLNPHKRQVRADLRPTHATTGCANQTCSPHSFTRLPCSDKRPPFVSSPTHKRTLANGHAGILCIGGAEKYVPTFPPSLSLQRSPVTLLPRLPRFVHSPSRRRPLFSTCTGGYSFLARLKRGWVLQTAFARRAPLFLLRCSALRAPPSPLVCPRIPSPCPRVPRSLRAQNWG